MHISRKIGISLAAVVVALGVARYCAKERYLTVVFATVLLCAIADSLWEKRTFVGLRQVGTTIQRAQWPVFYWLVLLFYLVLVTGAIYSLFYSSVEEALHRLHT